jgi:hypothetical protein
MELNVQLEGQDAIADAEDLKDFIQQRGSTGLNEVEMGRTIHKEGEQGLGTFIGSLVLKLAGDEAIKGVVSLLNKWAEQRDKRVHLPCGVIIPAKTLSAEQIIELATTLKDCKS